MNGLYIYVFYVLQGLTEKYYIATQGTVKAASTLEIL